MESMIDIEVRELGSGEAYTGTKIDRINGERLK